MREPIEVNYEPAGEDWQVTVTGRGQTMRGKATGLIAARDRADQLVEKVAPDEEHRTVVHLLNGDALAFTSAYLSARLAKPTEMPGEDTADGDRPAGKSTGKPAEKRAGKPKAGTADKEAEAPKVPAPTPSSDQAQKASTS